MVKKTYLGHNQLFKILLQLCVIWRRALKSMLIELSALAEQAESTTERGMHLL
jgi:hypothetical protein